VHETPERPVLAEIDADYGLITAQPQSGEGWITIRAADAAYPGCYREAELYIGCGGCDVGVCSIPGGGFVSLGSVNVRIALGANASGKSAGELFVRAGILEADVYTPKALKLTTFDPSVIARQVDGTLRQVKSALALADIIVESDTAYSIRFYHISDIMGMDTNNLYVVDPGAEPITTWNIYNPDQDTTILERLVIEEITGGQITSFEYEWNGLDNSWSLNRGGIRKETREVEMSGNLRIETRRISGGDDVPASNQRKTFEGFAWGEGVIEDVADPDGANLRTEFHYQNDASLPGYGRMSAVLNPDGSWVRYGYDQDGRVTNEALSWLDAPFGATPTAAREIRYDYQSVDLDDAELAADKHRPRTVTESIETTPVSITYHAYKLGDSGGRIEITERAVSATAGYGHPQNLRTVREHYPDLGDDPATRKLKKVVHPDGRQESYEYYAGGFIPDPSPGEFIVGQGPDRMEIVTFGTVGSPDGIPNKTTRNVSVYDAWNRNVLRYTEIRTEVGYERIDWIAYQHDEWGRITGVLRSNGERVETVWECCGMASRTDEQGITTGYSYDDLKRVILEVRNGISRSFDYDAAGRTLKEIATAGGISLVASNKYDLAGRLLEQVNASNLKTAYIYQDGGRTVVQTMPGGGTSMVTRHADGQIRSVTGTAVVATYYEYGVNSDGSRWTIVRTGSENSAAWEKTTTDMLGRTIRVERPAFGGGTLVTVSVYDEDGRLQRVSNPSGQSTLDTFYEYDELGRVIRSGLDVNGNGSLDVGGPDRIQDHDEYYEFAEDDWWRVSLSRIYPFSDSWTAVTNSIRKVRLTGLGGETEFGILESDTISTDIHGNATRSRRYVDRANMTVREVIDVPYSVQDAVRVTVAERLVSETSTSGVITTNLYDAIGRLTETRRGSGDHITGRIISYNALNQIEWEEDIAGHRTTYTYDTQSGRRVSVADAMTNMVFTAYDLRGRSTNVWGATYPVAYGYDDFGRMIAMSTWRNANAAPDTTQWLYDKATGLLTNKLYANGHGPSYAYTPDGRLARRTWARGTTTDYYYDELGQVTLVRHSDGTTPNVSYTYNRIGQQTQVADNFGVRNFTYSMTTLQLTKEQWLYGDELVRVYDNSSRPAGIVYTDPNYGVGNAHYVVKYEYDDFGRLLSVTTATTDVFAVASQVSYTYHQGSDRITGLYSDTGFSSSRSYEPYRNLVTDVLNQHGPEIVSRFSYEHDALGRRDRRIDTGATTNHFGYNGRSELTAALMHTNSYSYGYDPIGNRTESEDPRNGQLQYVANLLNQYTKIANGVDITPTYDADGNMIGYDGWTFKWDAENRLLKASNDTVSVENVYDYMGRRVRKSVWVYESGHWTLVSEIVYVYDGWNVIREKNIQESIVREYDNYYVWGLDLSGSLQGAGGVGGLLAMHHQYYDLQPKYYAYAFDANGNVTEMVDTNGTVVARYAYDPYGNLVEKTGDPIADLNPYRFSTKYADDETGLVYYGFRFYSPTLGRWLSRDPIGETGGINLYSLSRNEPVSRVDYLGLFPILKHLAGCAFDFFKDLAKAEIDKGLVAGRTCTEIGNEMRGDITDMAWCTGKTFPHRWTITHEKPKAVTAIASCVLGFLADKSLEHILKSIDDDDLKTLIEKIIGLSRDELEKLVGDISSQIDIKAKCNKKTDKVDFDLILKTRYELDDFSLPLTEETIHRGLCEGRTVNACCGQCP
jgi:RHS repeat-associated protein